jgi:hypothetical protein
MVVIPNIVSLIRYTPGSQRVSEPRNRGIPGSESLSQNSGSDHIDEQEARSGRLCRQATLGRHRVNHASSSNSQEALENPTFDQVALPYADDVPQPGVLPCPCFKEQNLSESGNAQDRPDIS